MNLMKLITAAIAIYTSCGVATAECEFRTLSSVEWADRTNATLLNSIMNRNKVVRIGSLRKYSFTSAIAVRNFILTSGTPKALDATLTNPPRTKNNSLAGNLLATKLNVAADPSLGDAVVDATLATYDHDKKKETPKILCYPTIASYLSSKNGLIKVNELVSLADDLVGGNKKPIKNELSIISQLLVTINTSWTNGYSSQCNILQSCDGCFVLVGITLNNASQVDPNTRFSWRAEDDNGNILANGEVTANQFQGNSWLMADKDVLTIDKPVTIIVSQVNIKPRYCQYLINTVIFGKQTHQVSGYYDDCAELTSYCFPRIDCYGGGCQPVFR